MDIVIVRDGDGYRLLHGQLRLANVLREAGNALVHVPGEGDLRVLRERSGYIVCAGDRRVPLRLQ